jgi:hypothetical protein
VLLSRVVFFGVKVIALDFFEPKLSALTIRVLIRRANTVQNSSGYSSHWQIQEVSPDQSGPTSQPAANQQQPSQPASQPHHTASQNSQNVKTTKPKPSQPTSQLTQNRHTPNNRQRQTQQATTTQHTSHPPFLCFVG